MREINTMRFFQMILNAEYNIGRINMKNGKIIIPIMTISALMIIRLVVFFYGDFPTKKQCRTFFRQGF